jgi:hypothetical protein
MFTMRRDCSPGLSAAALPLIQRGWRNGSSVGATLLGQ